MSDEYVPTTEDVRNNMAFGAACGRLATLEPGGDLSAAMHDINWPSPGLRDVKKAQFDAWLAAHDREVAERAWESGLNTGIGFKTAMDILGPDAPEPTNPYREVTS